MIAESGWEIGTSRMHTLAQCTHFSRHSEQILPSEDTFLDDVSGLFAVARHLCESMKHMYMRCTRYLQ